MEVKLSCASPNQGNDLRSLRDWLPKADPGLQLDFEEPDPAVGDHLGVPMDELFAVIGAAADLVSLVAAVRGWVRNRFGRDVATEQPVARVSGPVTTIEVGPVTIRVTVGPGEAAPVIEADER